MVITNNIIEVLYILLFALHYNIQCTIRKVLCTSQVSILNFVIFFNIALFTCIFENILSRMSVCELLSACMSNLRALKLVCCCTSMQQWQFRYCTISHMYIEGCNLTVFVVVSESLLLSYHLCQHFCQCCYLFLVSLSLDASIKTGKVHTSFRELTSEYYGFFSIVAHFAVFRFCCVPTCVPCLWVI